MILVLPLLPLFAFQSRPASQPVSVPKGPPKLEMRSIFDGKSLDGWTTKGGRYAGKAVWAVEDGTLVGRTGPKGEGGLVFTEVPYASYQVELDVRIKHPFDSGVFCRMRPDLRGWQVTLDDRPGGEIGGIYSDGWLQHNPEGIKLWKLNEWNSMVVRCVGMPPHIQSWLGGKLLVDYRHRQRKGFAPFGLLGLQVHGSQPAWRKNQVAFRNIRIHELPVFDAQVFSVLGGSRLVPTEHGKKLGWRSLLAGDLDKTWSFVGGKGRKPNRRFADGVLEFFAEGPRGYLRTREIFKDFELRLDFKVSKGANSGVFLRGKPGGGDPAYSGCEIQVLDNPGWSAYKLKPYQYCGGLYASHAPEVDALYPTGAWNSYRIRYVGHQIRVELNGQQLYDVDTYKVPGKPFAERAPEGFLGLQLHGGVGAKTGMAVAYRNIYVRRL